MNIYSKFKWVLGILIVFILILTTNLVDRNNFSRVNDSVITIYEDRLIASDIVFEIFKQIKNKELAVKLSDSIFFHQNNESINNNIDNLVARFEKTKLTTDENIILINLKNNIKTLKGLENIYLKSNFENTSNLEIILDEIDKNLSGLSEIQLIEGRRQMSISKKAMGTVELFTQIEIYLLIFLAIAIQIIVMYKSKNLET